ncbi:unnamed protein product [Soboliphyme baturini]|uniref:Dolichol kinase n=1 Tax=Soboliphyme baturini TaxID=241478 RepID=A0A183INE3_9BILA|nr:unnamed protein product [Soboliphyme baturini]
MRRRNLGGMACLTLWLPHRESNPHLGYRNRRVFICGWAQAVLGAAALANAFAAAVTQAVKPNHVTEHLNIHWMTSVYLLTACLTVMAESFQHNALLASLNWCANITALIIATGKLLTDCVDIDVVVTTNWSSLLSSWKLLISFTSVDMVIAVGIIVVSLTILRETYITPNDKGNLAVIQSQSRRCRIFGAIAAITAAITAGLRIALWGREYKWVRNVIPAARHLFLNSVADEPVWGLLCLMAATLNLFASLGNSRLLSRRSFALTAITLHPVIEYLSIDYRWLLLTTRLADPDPSDFCKTTTLLAYSVIAEALQLAAATTTLSTWIKRFSDGDGNKWVRQSDVASKELKIGIFMLGGGLLITGLALLAVDLRGPRQRIFLHRFLPITVGHLQLPLSLTVTGITVSTAFSGRLSMHACYSIPTALAFTVRCLHSALYEVVAYMCNAFGNQSSSRHLCQLLIANNLKKTACIQEAADDTEYKIRFAEVLLASFSLLLSCCSTFALSRMVCLFRPRPEVDSCDDASNEKDVTKRKTTCSYLLKVVCYCQVAVAVCGHTICLLTEQKGATLQPLSSGLQTTPDLIASSISSLVPSLVQLALTHDLDERPVKQLAVIAIAVEHVTCITANLGLRDRRYVASTRIVVTTVQLTALLLQFSTICISAAYSDFKWTGSSTLNINSFEYVKLKECATDKTPKAEL